MTFSRNPPEWPGYLRRQSAARYCDISPVKFDEMVRGGILPPPAFDKGRLKLWSRAEIDAALTPEEREPDTSELVPCHTIFPRA